jgi:hypothetical protein
MKYFKIKYLITFLLVVFAGQGISQINEVDTSTSKILVAFLTKKNEISSSDKYSLFSELIIESNSFKLYRFGVRGLEEREYIYFWANNKIEVIENYYFNDLIKYLSNKFDLHATPEDERVKITIKVLEFLQYRLSHEESFILPLD